VRKKKKPSDVIISRYLDMYMHITFGCFPFLSPRVYSLFVVDDDDDHENREAKYVCIYIFIRRHLLVIKKKRGREEEEKTLHTHLMFENALSNR
jgi:hypothetical protein